MIVSVDTQMIVNDLSVWSNFVRVMYELQSLQSDSEKA